MDLCQAPNRLQNNQSINHSTTWLELINKPTQHERTVVFKSCPLWSELFLGTHADHPCIHARLGNGLGYVPMYMRMAIMTPTKTRPHKPMLAEWTSEILSLSLSWV